MAVFNVMFPVLPGKDDAARAWIEEFSGPRRAGFDELQGRSEIERETLTLLKTPMGSFLLVWFDRTSRRRSGPCSRATMSSRSGTGSSSRMSQDST